jgi:hypothetical protein
VLTICIGDFRYSNFFVFLYLSGFSCLKRFKTSQCNIAAVKARRSCQSSRTAMSVFVNEWRPG